MGLGAFLKNLFGGTHVQSAQENPVRSRTPLPKGFSQDKSGPARESLSTDSMQVLYEWTFPYPYGSQPLAARIGQVGDTIVVTVPTRDWSAWYGTFLIEKKNVPLLIQLFEDAYQNKWNCQRGVSILAAEPDYIMVCIGTQKDGYLMLLSNHRDINLDTHRYDTFDLNFSIEHTRTFLEELKKIGATL